MHRIPRVLRLALLAFGLGGCGGEGDGTEAARTAPDTAGGPPPATSPGAALPGLTLPAILDRVHDRTESGELRMLDDMIPPLQTTVEAVPNRHDPQATDTVRTLHYGGLDVEIHEAASTGREIVRRITVSDDTYDTGLGFGVGATRDELVGALGQPARDEGRTLLWELTRGEQDPTPTELEVELGPDDRVRSVTWSYYVD